MPPAHSLYAAPDYGRIHMFMNPSTSFMHTLTKALVQTPHFDAAPTITQFVRSKMRQSGIPVSHQWCKRYQQGTTSSYRNINNYNKQTFQFNSSIPNVA
ncbi:unnamed protein product [Ceratitis capitata]|uniref:(Mediterranean fruit fly) hypothetical protein n=1 Tax=Ceratitis capitata TaxID=7213 RepID=A0A811UA81_CERCA|nr:unnamed protein product [Ceratitis capitata]